MTSTIRGIPEEVPLGPPEGLTRAWIAKLDIVHVVPQALLRERSNGRLPRSHSGRR